MRLYTAKLESNLKFAVRNFKKIQIFNTVLALNRSWATFYCFTEPNMVEASLNLVITIILCSMMHTINREFGKRINSIDLVRSYSNPSVCTELIIKNLSDEHIMIPISEMRPASIEFIQDFKSQQELAYSRPLFVKGMLLVA